MQEDVNSIKKCNHQNRDKEKPGIRKLFRNGKKIQYIMYNRNITIIFYHILNILSLQLGVE